MKRTAFLACLLFTSLAPVRGAEPAPPPFDPQILAAIKELQAQQTAIADSQAKIEEKLALVAEAVRVARIYSSRSGN